MGCRLWGRTESDTTEVTQQQQQQQQQQRVFPIRVAGIVTDLVVCTIHVVTHLKFFSIILLRNYSEAQKS